VPPPKKIIYEGPASLITPDVRRRCVPVPAPPAPSSALTRVRWRKGSRRQRAVPLTEDDLYLDGARPPVRAPSSRHRCQLCHCIKSHPVMYVSATALFYSSHCLIRAKCGHSYCYVCIRLRLEREWTCPYANCSRIIRRAPKIDDVEQDSINMDYPEHNDETRVSYSWEGLTFPLRPKPIEILSSP
jgi:hypothetical protein